MPMMDTSEKDTEFPTKEPWKPFISWRKTEGILLDPVYSGKGMAGLIDHVRKGTFSKNEKILFLHTGGSTALFAYEKMLLDA